MEQQTSKTVEVEFNFSGRLSSIACKLRISTTLSRDKVDTDLEGTTWSFCTALQNSAYWIKRVISRLKFPVCTRLCRRSSDVSIVCRHLTM